MKFKVKFALLALSTAAVALQGMSCLFRWLGDTIGDSLWLRGID